MIIPNYLGFTLPSSLKWLLFRQLAWTRQNHLPEAAARSIHADTRSLASRCRFASGHRYRSVVRRLACPRISRMVTRSTPLSSARVPKVRRRSCTHSPATPPRLQPPPGPREVPHGSAIRVPPERGRRNALRGPADGLFDVIRTEGVQAPSVMRRRMSRGFRVRLKVNGWTLPLPSLDLSVGVVRNSKPPSAPTRYACESPAETPTT